MSRKTASGIMLTLLLISMLTLAFGIQPIEAEPKTIIVPDDYPTIQEAINNAVIGDTIFVKEGTYCENVIVNKTVSLVGENRDTTIIDANGIGTVVTVDQNNVKITEFHIRNGELTYPESAIHLYQSSGNNISHNILTNSMDGLRLVGSSNNVIADNVGSNNWVGIRFDYSCHSNILAGNVISNNVLGIVFKDSNNNMLEENVVSDNSYDGISFWQSHNNTLTGNIVSNHESDGIHLDYSSNNTLTNNTISSNRECGIWVYYSYNIIYHNNFVDNAKQVEKSETSISIWDDGYPSGGNYWSDYEDRYPDAQEIDDSGIWDTPYVLDEINQDNYPLMEPWTPKPPSPTTIHELKTEIEELGSEGEIDNQGVVRSLLAKLDVAQKLIDDGKIDQAKNMLNAFINEVQAQSGKHITPEAADVLIESAEYIISHL